MWPFPVGSRVIITSYGHQRFGVEFSNPKNTEGVVVKTRGNWADVKWDNGGNNCYVERSIELAPPISLENE